MKELLLIAGLSPLVIFSVIFMIKKKAILIPVISIFASCAVITAGFFIMRDKQDSNSIMPAAQLNYLANANMISGNTDKAGSYLEKIYKYYGDTAEGLASAIRLSILEGDEQSALVRAFALARYAGQTDSKIPEDIKEFVDSVSSGSYVSLDRLKAAKALYESIKSSSKPEDYGIQKVSDGDLTAAKEASETLKKNVTAYVDKQVKNYIADNSSVSEISKAIEASNRLVSACSSYSESSDSESLKTVKTLTAALGRMYENDSQIFSLSEIRDAYILGLVTSEKYTELINYAAKSGDNTALATVANLYISGTIEKKHFPKDFTENADYSKVLDKCGNIYKKIDAGDYTNAELSSIKSNIQTIIVKNNNPILAEIENRLTPEDAPSEERAGIYLQDSGINSSLSDKDAAFEALDKALENLNSSDNTALTDALEEISSIVDNSSSSDNITSLDTFLAEAYKSSLPISSHVDVTVPEEYLNTSNSYANEKRTMINIGIVKTDDFPEIKAYVSTSGTDITDRDNLVITDCGSVIEDYTIEKVAYSSSNIFLVCDNSGSMSGDIGALKDAVTQFVSSKNKKEQIGIITFDYSVITNTGLSKNNDDLQSAIDGFFAGGGTNIGSGVNAAFDGLSSSDKSFNAIIVMTDGQDATYESQSALNELRKRCIENNVVLYTIGLGDVSTEYLQNVADSGMGSFIYSSDSVQLKDLYTFIHNQLDNNYMITYKAKDTSTQKNRLLTVTNTSDGYTGKRYYSLNYTDDENKDNENSENMLKGIRVSRLGISTVIKGANEKAQFTVLGSGFDKAKNISVSISGKKLYSNLEYTLDNDKKFTVTVPADTSYDTYDVIITIDGVPCTLSGLSILKTGASSTVSFGDYVFSALSVSTQGNTTYLRGNVVMNNYLHFNGDVTLTGSLEGNSINISESSGSYITYGTPLPGLLNLFFDNTVSLPAVSGLSIYKTDERFDKYYTHGKTYYGPLEIYDPYIEIHPEYVQMTISSLNFDFPILNNLLDYVESPISATSEEHSVIVTGEKAGIAYKFSSDTNASSPLRLGPAKLGLSHVELDLNTINHDYSAGLSVDIDGVPLLGDDDGVSFGLNIGISSGRFDSLDLSADVDINVVKVPPALNVVTINDFHAGVENLADEEQNASLGSRLLGAAWYGQCDVNFLKLNQLIPGIGALLKDILDISILNLDDTKLSITLNNWNVSLDTTAVLLEVVELGKLEVDIGHYSYSNYLLGISDSEAAGVHAAVTNDLNIDLGNNFKFNTSGSTQIDVNDKFMGFTSNGKIDYDIKIFKKFHGDTEGNLVIGIHNGGTQFTVLVKGDDYSNGSDAGIRITLTNGEWLPDITLY